MTFSVIMTFICIAYILIYAGMILYDMFLAKEAVDLTPKVEEVEIDISDEAKAFQPIEIDKNEKPNTKFAQVDIREKMTGGIDYNKVIIMLEDLSAKGKDSALGSLTDDWRKYASVA